MYAYVPLKKVRNANGYAISCYPVHSVIVAKLLLYLERKGYEHWYKSNFIIVRVRNSQERKRLVSILYHYGVKEFTSPAIISKVKIPELDEKGFVFELDV